MPPISSPVRDFLPSCEETPVLPQLQAEPSASTQPSSVSLQPSPEVLSPLRTSPRYSPLGEGTEGEEGQFDDAEEGEICGPQRLHPSEQPLPSSPSPSPTPSPVPSQVNQLVQCILETKRPVSGPGFQTVSPDAVAMSPDAVAVSPDAVAVSPDTVAVSPDTVAVAADHPDVLLCPEEQGLNDVTPMDTSAQEEIPNALHANPNNTQPRELPPLPPNAGKGTLIKQLFAPRGAFAAPRVVCPSPVVRKSAKELTTLEPVTLPPLLPRMHIRLMTIDYGRLSSPSPAPSPVDTPIQAALNQVTSSQPRLSTFADQPNPTELTLPKPYSTPLPRTSPVTPVVDKVPVDSLPSPMDSENDLPLNSIPVAELRNAFLPEDASLMPVILTDPAPRNQGLQ